MRHAMVSFLFCVCAFLFSGSAFADDKGGGGGGGGGGDNGKQPTAAEVAALKEENERLKREIAEAKKKPDPDDKKKDDEKNKHDDEDDLRKKVAKDKERAEDSKRETKRIEAAVSFTHGVDDYLKSNKDLLPSEISEIVAKANKETYDSVQAKASALKSGMIQSFFAVQSNLDVLTRGQKESLDDYLKLTKTGKEEKAANIYENIFEPALETLRRVKKAEELARSRGSTTSGTTTQNTYRDRLVQNARKHHLNEKGS